MIFSENVGNTKRIIKAIEKWCLDMGMVLNKQKCGIMFLNESRKNLCKWEQKMGHI